MPSSPLHPAIMKKPRTGWKVTADVVYQPMPNALHKTIATFRAMSIPSAYTQNAPNSCRRLLVVSYFGLLQALVDDVAIHLIAFVVGKSQLQLRVVPGSREPVEPLCDPDILVGRNENSDAVFMRKIP
jgi:hypothetical protein